jgi:aminoglycoside 3-N-acetyltransferase
VTRYSLRDLHDALATLGLAPGDTVLVQASLMDLGMPDVPPRDLPAAVYDALRERVGADGTLCLATFTFGTTRGDAFDPASSATGNGALAEYARRRPGALRSPHPIQSVVAEGPNASWICAHDTASGYDPRGPFGVLLALEAKVLLIGRNNVDTASLAHYAEEAMRVPYRHWKEFQVAYGPPGSLKPRTSRMYVRDEASDPVVDVRAFAVELERAGTLRAVRVGASDVRLGRARDIVAAACERLAAEPWSFVTGRAGPGGSS